jgi:Putative adhesin
MTAWLVDSPQRLALDGDVEELHVWLASGKLRVVGTDGPARLEVTKVGSKGVAVTLEERALSVRHEFPQSWWARWGPFWWFLSGRPKYHAHVTIAVPPKALASLTLISGSVVASGLRHGATVDVTSGSITLMGLGGTVRAKTVSGTIQALGVAGDLTLETVSGEITLAESSAERVYARTISGSVTCDLDNPLARDVRLDTTSGEITVRVPVDADLIVNLSAISGRVTSAFPEVHSSRTPGLHAANGRIGSGSGTLNAHAVSGSVSLLARPSEDFTEPTDAGAQ